MTKNIPEDFEKTLCEDCDHKKAAHYNFSRIPEGESIPDSGCRECDCKKFITPEKQEELQKQPRSNSS